MISFRGRSGNVKKSIIWLSLLRLISAISSFFMVRVSYDYFNNDKLFGIWMTILTILYWMGVFDLGIGNGLRNKLAEAMAKNEHKKGAEYVSSTYYFTGVLVIALSITFFIISPYINWNIIFQYKDSITSLELAMKVLVILYLIQFVLSLIQSICYAMQDSIYPSLFLVSSNVITVILILILRYIPWSDKLSPLVWMYSGVYLTILLIGNIYLFSRKYTSIVPRWSLAKYKTYKGMLSMGIKFFIIQIANLVVYMSDNMIIVQLFGPEFVTPYQILYRLFSILIVVQSVVMSPLWSAFTDAYYRNDIGWLRKTMKKLMYYFVGIVLCTFFIALIHPFVIKIWMGKEILFPQGFVSLMVVYIIIFVWSTTFNTFLQGVNQINFQMYLAIFSSLLNIPLAILLGKYYGLGLNGVLLSNIITLLGISILGPIRTYRILSKS